MTADLAALLHAEVAAGRTPGLAAAVSRPGRPVELATAGVDGRGRELDPGGLYPVASITKLAVALAVHRLVDAGDLTPEDELARHLPDAAAAVPGVSLRSLLAHTSGLPSELPDGAAPYAPGLDWPRLAAACLRVAPERPPGASFRYGNVEYGLLGVVIERRTGRPLATALGELVFDPLGVEAYLGVEPPRPPAAIGGVGEQAGTELESFNSPFWRSLAMPWAGLVTTPAGALALVRAFAGEPPGYLRTATLAAATRDQTGGLPTPGGSPFDFLRGPWGLGPEVRADKDLCTPAEAGPDSFGHIGATGCVAWYAPATGVAWALLSNRAFGGPTSWLLTRAAPVAAAILAAS
ncbi:MAG TPA: serine hydrolase domain-containing protein [Candidatus Dormibacteraeota bacterium]|nr:serine hydrolase domain-containing protein [Candidatus Dormibacteraeota bacterium]